MERTHVSLSFLADSVNPALAILALAVTAWEWRRRGAKVALRFFAGSALGLAAIYGIHFADRAYGIWARFGGNYSTHMAFAASLVTSLIVWRRRWAGGLGGILAAYAILIVALGYHTVADVIIAAVLAAVLTLLAQRPFQLA